MMCSKESTIRIQALTNSLIWLGFSVILLCSSCVSLNKVTRHSYEVPQRGADAPKYYINSVEIQNDNLSNNPLKKDPRFAKLFVLKDVLNEESSQNITNMLLGLFKRKPSEHPLIELRYQKQELRNSIVVLEKTLKKGSKIVSATKTVDENGTTKEIQVREERKLTQEEIAETESNIIKLKEELQKVEKNIELETENTKQEIAELKDEINQMWRNIACRKYPDYFSASPEGAISIDVEFGPRERFDVTSGLKPLNSLTSLCGLIYPVFTADEYERNVQIILKDKNVFSSKISDKKTHASGWLIACIWSPLLHMRNYSKKYDGLLRGNALEVEPSPEAVIQTIRTIPEK